MPTLSTPSQFLSDQLAEASPDLLRSMLSTFMHVVCHDKWHLLYTLFGTVRSSPPHTTSPVTSNNPPYGN